jgi:NitT/TauT family transport system substrate-binding protein
MPGVVPEQRRNDMIRRPTIAVVGALCALAAATTSPAAAQDKKFVIAAPGIPPVFASAILYVADKEGMFKKYKTNVEVRPFETGAAASRAVITGDIEMSLSPSALLINQISNTNAPVVAIYGLPSSDFALASVDPSKTKCSDVKGQGVGVDAIGGARWIALRTMLSGGCKDVTIKDVQPVALSSNVAPAMVAGRLSFGVVHLDDVSTIEAQGKKVTKLVTAHDADPNGHYLAFIVRQDKLKTDRDLYVRVMAALIDAARFIHDPKNADKVGADSTPTGHTKEVSKATIKPLLDIGYWPVKDDGLEQKRFEALTATMKKVGGIQPGKEPVKYDRLADNSVFRDALAMVEGKK